MIWVNSPASAFFETLKSQTQIWGDQLLLSLTWNIYIYIIYIIYLHYLHYISMEYSLRLSSRRLRFWGDQLLLSLTWNMQVYFNIFSCGLQCDRFDRFEEINFSSPVSLTWKIYYTVFYQLIYCFCISISGYKATFCHFVILVWFINLMSDI